MEHIPEFKLDECSSDTDRDNLSQAYKPIFSQQIEQITHLSPTKTPKLPSALKALMRLASVERADQIGQSGPVLAAGSSEQNAHVEQLGLYQEVYPRDAHTTAHLLWFKYPELTRTTILACLPYTGKENTLSNTQWRDEQEVGKIPHQVRSPDHPRSVRQFELRQRGYPYYGAIDTTQKNMLAITRLSLSDPPESLAFLEEQYQDLDEQSHSVFEGFNAHVEWVKSRMALNPEGLIESLQVNPLHHANQSWADSPDAFHHADGSLAQHYPEKNFGVASVEVNAETYDALLEAIRLYETVLLQLEGAERAELEVKIETLKHDSAKLKRSILENFWVEDADRFGGYFARGTDRDEHGNLRPLKIRSSDMGHLLLSNVLEPNDPKIDSVINNLFSPEMLAQNGIRTLASDSVRYHPEAYHNGSVWPWDTYTIALGLQKHGYHELAKELEDRILRFYEQTHSLAEYGSGAADNAKQITQQVTVFDPSLHTEHIDQYSAYNIIQPPQEIQAWTVAAVLAIKYKRADRR